MDHTLLATLNRKWPLTEILMNNRLLNLMFLGFASGLPLLLIGSTLQAWYAVSNVNIVTIGWLSLVGQPYVYKFLWAPLLDRYALPWLGRRRGWIFAIQILLIITISSMAILQPAVYPLLLAFVALVVAFFSATQDILIDAYRTEILQPEERGAGAGIFTIGYRIAMLVAGALALVMADYIGWKLTYWFMAALMALQLIVTYHVTEPTIPKDRSHTEPFWTAFIKPFLEFFSKKYALIVLLFIVIYKLGDVFTLTLGTAFLVRGIGFSLTDVGLAYKLIGMIGLFSGVIVGGIWMRHLSLLRALVFFGIIQAIANLPFMVLALVGKNYWLLVMAVFIENLGSGLGSVAFLAFIMGLCNYRYTATQFALLSAFAAIGRVFVGPISGIMVEHIGWVQFYFWAFLLGFPGIILLSCFKKHRVFSS